METIKAILDALFQKKNLQPKLKGGQVFDIWEEVVGPRIARHSQPKSLSDNTLWVTVDNSIWMQQLKFLEGKIKEKLNQQVGSTLIEKLRFQIGEIHCPAQEAPEKTNPPAWQTVDLDNTTEEDIEKEVAVLQDEELKARLKNLFRKSVQFLSYKAKE